MKISRCIVLAVAALAAGAASAQVLSYGQMTGRVSLSLVGLGEGEAMRIDGNRTHAGGLRIAEATDSGSIERTMFCLTPQLRLMAEGQTRTFERYIVDSFAGIPGKGLPSFTAYDPASAIAAASLGAATAAEAAFRSQMAIWGLSLDGNFSSFSAANSNAATVARFDGALKAASHSSVLAAARGEHPGWQTVIYVPVRQQGGEWVFDNRNQVLSSGEFVINADPVPEPMTLGLVLAGLAAAMRRRRARR